jgi:hypothetical protein
MPCSGSGAVKRTDARVSSCGIGLWQNWQRVIKSQFLSVLHIDFRFGRYLVEDIIRAGLLKIRHLKKKSSIFYPEQKNYC